MKRMLGFLAAIALGAVTSVTAAPLTLPAGVKDDITGTATNFGTDGLVVAGAIVVAAIAVRLLYKLFR